MATNHQRKDVPAVPLRTPMFDSDGKLTRTWIIFFERLGSRTSSNAGPYIRTLVLKDLTVGDDIADHVPIYIAGSAIRVIGVLRKAITADLVVRINLDGDELLTATIPADTAADTPLEFTGFIDAALADLAVLSFDITGSDGQIDSAGVATFTLQWQ